MEVLDGKLAFHNYNVNFTLAWPTDAQVQLDYFCILEIRTESNIQSTEDNSKE